MKLKLLSTIVWANLALVVASAPAASLTLTSTAPTPGTYDIYNFTGAAADGGNVNDGGTYLNGYDNDAFTYVAGDQTTKGQTFTTGGLSGGYSLSSIWVQHAGYTSNASQGSDYNGTWWHMAAGGTLTLRVTDPSQAGSAGFVLATETYTTTGLEGWGTGYNNSDNGDGMWLDFALATPVALNPDKTYGFDLTGSANNNVFFEWLGTSSDAFSGGSAYRGSTVATPDNTLNGLVGDRVFLLGLSPVPEPSTLALMGLAGLAFLLRRRSA